MITGVGGMAEGGLWLRSAMRTRKARLACNRRMHLRENRSATESGKSAIKSVGGKRRRWTEKRMKHLEAYSMYSLQGCFAACGWLWVEASLISVFCPVVTVEGGGWGGTPALPAF